ncbi:MAG: AAA family ATPase [Rhodobacteraceae bacterium]|nr:AAA family ATPase [Paracoccaceae bacterium]
MTKPKAAPERPGRAIFQVKNFGPIAQGKVDLRPLTVFTGPGNTGKSWLATLIYVTEQHPDMNPFREFPFALRHQSGPFPENPKAWLESLRKGEALPLTDSDRKVLESASVNMQKRLEDDFLRCFGMSDPGHLVREGAKVRARITIDYGDSARSALSGQDVKINRAGKVSLDVNVAETWPLPFARSPHLKEMFLQELEEYVQNAGSKAGDRSTRSIMSSLSQYYRFYDNPISGFYLPADRGGVMHAHHVVVSALIQSASRAGLGGGSSLPALSGVLTDFLQNLVELASPSGVMRYRSPRRRDSGKDRADSLESNILNGKITVERTEVNYPRFTYTPKGWNRSLPLVNVSSMVSELAPVALYLRHYVRPGDLLILEEPEAHLHPGMQVAFAREIAGWVRQGIRVLLTTHSEWVLEEIANLVAAGEAGEPDALSPDEVGVWRFELPKGARRGTRICEMKWDKEQGGYDPDFDAVAQDLHNRWADIINGTS